MKTAAPRIRGVDSNEASDHSEGYLARTLEDSSAQLPSDIWLWAALSSMGLSLAFKLNGRADKSLFVGQWAAPFLLIGVYNKIVKVSGSDRVNH